MQVKRKVLSLALLAASVGVLGYTIVGSRPGQMPHQAVAEEIVGTEQAEQQSQNTDSGRPAADRPQSQEEFKSVQLDGFILSEQQAVQSMKGKKMIKMAAPIRFVAKMKRFPEERDMSYVYVALEMSGISPMPSVHHRMFVESEEGRIIPVYVEQAAVEKLNGAMKVDHRAEFLGYHVYTYSKGPAILVVDFQPAR